MAEQLNVTVNLTNRKVQFTGVAGSHPPVIFDHWPPLGDGKGYSALEMLLMSFAACSGTTVVSLLRRMRKDVAWFQVAAKGLRREAHPMSFKKIVLEFTLESKDATDSDIQTAIQQSEETYCPVWAMLRNNVKITSEYQITVPGAEEAGSRDE
jgi:putative redox protein